jgi:hypothetical protein
MPIGEGFNDHARELDNNNITLLAVSNAVLGLILFKFVLYLNYI